MDIVLNHSGSAHKVKNKTKKTHISNCIPEFDIFHFFFAQWFKQSQLSTSPYKDYYIWSKGKLGGINDTRPLPPNNWVITKRTTQIAWNVCQMRFHGLLYFSRFRFTTALPGSGVKADRNTTFVSFGETSLTLITEIRRLSKKWR